MRPEEDILVRKMALALDTVGVSVALRRDKIEKAARLIWDRIERVNNGNERKIERMLNNGFTDFRKNLVGTLAWAAAHGETSEHLVGSFLNHPPLWTFSSETLKQKFDENVAWLALYGGDRTIWGSACRSKPSNYHQLPLTLRQNFELSLALFESPYYLPWTKNRDRVYPPSRLARHKPRPDNEAGLSFRALRMKRILVNASKSEKDILLRMAFLEIADPAPSAKILKQTRRDVERALVQALGRDPNQTKIGVLHRPSPYADDKDAREELKDSFKRLAEQLVEDVRTLPEPTEPRRWKHGPLSILAPKGDEAQTAQGRALILERLIHGGLLKHYRIAYAG